MSTSNTLREQVRERYAQAAQIAEEGRSVIEAQACGCGDTCCSDGSRSDGCCGDECCGGGTPAQDFGETLYSSDERAELPEAAALASLGCGNPTAVADLREGETVLDLGSGGGIDVILSAKRVGPRGTAYGLDMTEEMLALATRNAQAAGVSNAIFLRGVIEDVPLPAGSVDVVISNCVINLSTDKPAVLREIARVLRPGGRIGISDVVANDGLTVEDRAERGSYVGCIAGALSASEYAAGLEAVGFTDITIEKTHPVADGMHAAIVRARRGDAMVASGRALPLVAASVDGGCC
jgi:arsenite methyltransferase